MTCTDAPTDRPADAGVPSTHTTTTKTRRRRLAALVLLGLAYAGLAVICGAGCAQSTTTPSEQRQLQDVTTPTTNEQGQATQGSSVNIWVINAPGKHGTPATPLANLGEGEVATLLGQIDGPETDYQAASAGYVMGGIDITVTTGGTTPSVSGTATGRATAAANPSSTQSASPVQRIRPDTGISAPVGVAPGGIVDQTAAATGGPGRAGATAEGSNQLTRAQLDALEKQYPQLVPLIEALLAPGAGSGPAKSTSAPAQ